MVKAKDDVVLGLKKIHVIIATLGAIVTPSVVVTASILKAKAEVDNKINAIQLENVKTFAKASDFKEMNEKIDNVQSDVSEIKGYLRIKRHRQNWVENGE